MRNACIKYNTKLVREYFQKYFIEGVCRGNKEEINSCEALTETATKKNFQLNFM